MSVGSSQHLPGEMQPQATLDAVILKNRDTAVFIAASAAAIVAWSPTWLQPVMLAEFLTHGNISKSAAGLIITIEMVALSASSAACARRSGPSLLTVALPGILIAALGDILSMTSRSYGALIFARALAGIGEGALLMAANASLARLSDATRAYGRRYVVTNLTAALVLYTISYVAQLTGRTSAFPSLLLLLVITTPALLALPRVSASAGATLATDSIGTKKVASPAILMIAAAQLAFLVATASSWPSYLVIGLHTGLSTADATRAIALSQVFALGGSMFVSIIGTRMGRLPPTMIALIAVQSAAFCLTHTDNHVLFSLCISVAMFAGYFVVPYFYGYAAAFDGTGRGVALVGASAPLAFALGPYLGGIILQRTGIGGLGWFAVSAGSVAIVLLCAVNSLLGRQAHT